jgi:Flp pilus assembly protein CpaB
VVGGLLVAVAAVGTFAAWSGANKGPSSRYVVATHTVAAGTALGPEDMKTVAIDLPAAVAERSFSDRDALVHSITLGPLESGELVQSGNVLPARGAKPHPEFSFGIDAERAVDGSLRPGDRIDILVTYGTGAGSVTQLVSSDARVLGVDGGAASGLSDARRQVLTVALTSADEVLAVTNAARAGEMTVARSTGVEKVPTIGSFQPHVPEPGSAGAPTTTAPAAAPNRSNP